MAGITTQDQGMATPKLPVTLSGSINQLYEVVNRLEDLVGISDMKDEAKPQPQNKILSAANAIDDIRNRISRVCSELEVIG